MIVLTNLSCRHGGHGLRLAFQFSAWGRLRGLHPGKTMTKSAKLPAYRTGVRPSPFFSSFTVECVSWYCRKANTFGKTKAILFLLWSIWFFREVFGFALRYFCFCREVFGFAVRYFVFAVMFLFLPWQLWATIALCLPLLDRPKKREKTILQGALHGLAWRSDRWRH